MSTGRQIDIALGVLGAETGFIGLTNSNDGAEQLVGISQLAAGINALRLTASPASILAANAIAANLTLAKIQLDLRDTGDYSTDDMISLAGNIVAMAAAGAIYLTPVGRASHSY